MGTVCLSLQVKNRSVRCHSSFQGFSQVRDLPAQIQSSALLLLQHGQRWAHFCPHKKLQSEIKPQSPLKTRVYCVLKLLGVCYQWQRTGNSSEGKTTEWLRLCPQEVAVSIKTRYVCLFLPFLIIRIIRIKRVFIHPHQPRLATRGLRSNKSLKNKGLKRLWNVIFQASKVSAFQVLPPKCFSETKQNWKI